MYPGLNGEIIERTPVYDRVVEYVERLYSNDETQMIPPVPADD